MQGHEACIRARPELTQQQVQQLTVKKVNVQDGTYLLSGENKAYSNEELWIPRYSEYATPYQHGQRVEHYDGTRLVRGTIVCHQDEFLFVVSQSGNEHVNKTSKAMPMEMSMLIPAVNPGFRYATALLEF